VQGKLIGVDANGTSTLGNGVGSDQDGQLDANPTGDDTDGGDDEDGVDFTTLSVFPAPKPELWSPLREMGSLTVGWILTAMVIGMMGVEEIYTNQPLTTGVSKLSFAVSADANSGTCFAHFRFSTQPSLNYIEGVPD
jgi:hypothetical protein